MIFETKRLILRPWEEADAESLYKYAKDPDVGPVAGWPVHTSPNNSREIIKDVLSADGTFAVILKETGEAVGSIGLIPPMQSHTKAEPTEVEIGYWIGKPYWGQGLIPEAVCRLQKYAFEELGCSAMWCGYYDGNRKSARVQEKCGFEYHHTEKDKPCDLIGDIRTEHFTCLTREQWEKRLITRSLSEREVSEALELAWEVFKKYESPDYSPEGTEEFRKCLHDAVYLNGIIYYGALLNEKLVGILGISKEKCHICFFFVRGENHRQGIGTKLFHRMRQDFAGKRITLNSSPYGLPFYRYLGLVPTDEEKTVNGIRFTPMEYFFPNK